MGVFNTDTYVGGLVSEGTYRIQHARFEQFDYDGKAPTPAVGLMVDLVDPEGQAHERQFWSIGAHTLWSVGDTDQEVKPIGTSRGVRENSNFATLITSIENAGYPKERLTDEAATPASILDGLLAYFIYQKAQGREGMPPPEPRINPATGEAYPQRDLQVLVVAEIKEFPWDAKGGGETAPATSRGRGTSGPTRVQSARPVSPAVLSSNGNIPTEEEAAQKVLELTYAVLAETGAPVERVALMQRLMTLEGVARTPWQAPMAVVITQRPAIWQQWADGGQITLDGSKVGMPGLLS